MKRAGLAVATVWMFSSTLCAEDVPVTDPAAVLNRLHEILSRPEYREAADPAAQSHLRDYLSLWFTHLGTRFGQFKYASEIPGLAALFLTLFVGLVFAGMIYFAWRLARRHQALTEPADAPDLASDPLRPPEFYDEEIRQAVARADWSTAWRSGWRQFLSRLEQAQLVPADRTRTNREYLAELRGQTLPAPALALLVALVDAYDRHIYGRRVIGQEDWTRFRDQLSESALHLHLDEATGDGA